MGEKTADVVLRFLDDIHPYTETNMVLCNTGQGHGSTPVTENSCQFKDEKNRLRLCQMSAVSNWTLIHWFTSPTAIMKHVHTLKGEGAVTRGRWVFWLLLFLFLFLLFVLGAIACFFFSFFLFPLSSFCFCFFVFVCLFVCLFLFFVCCFVFVVFVWGFFFFGGGGVGGGSQCLFL